MDKPLSLEQSYLLMFKLLLMSKHRLVELGNACDLTVMQTTVLCFLDEPRPMYGFKKIFNCDASNVTGIVDGLVQKQLVSRYEDDKDRRIKMVKLEPKGVKVRAQLVHDLTTQDKPLLDRLNAEEQATLMALFQKMAAPAKD